MTTDIKYQATKNTWDQLENNEDNYHLLHHILLDEIRQQSQSIATNFSPHIYHARFRVALLWHSVVTLLQVLHSVKQCYIFLHSVTQCYILLHSVTQCYIVLHIVT
jgi:hypothetical protein